MDADNILALWGNWRASKAADGTITVEIRDADGTWMWPDCRWRCAVCGECLGCMKNLIYDEDDDGVPIINDWCGRCAKSPTHLHIPLEAGCQAEDY